MKTPEIAVKATLVDESLENVSQKSSFLQSRMWALFKGHYGWKPFFFKLEVAVSSQVLDLGITVLVRRFFKLLSLAYIPMAPDIHLPEELVGKEDEVRAFYAAILAKTAAAIKGFLPRNVFCIRFDPPFEKGALDLRAQEYSGKKLPVKVLKAVSDIQPPDTVILDLEQDTDALLAAMKPKWRYNIRLAEKKGVHVFCFHGVEALKVQGDLPANANTKPIQQGYEPEVSPLDIFYNLYLETAQRDGIVIHEKKYYEMLFTLCSEDALCDLRLYIAKSEGESLAAIITLFYGDQATYLYGASSAKKRFLMPAYALQWQAIKDAKAAQCLHYDFYGIPPTDDESHPMHGLYRFKTGFGGKVVHRCGSIDIPCKSFTYRICRVAESLRLFWFKGLRKALKSKPSS